MVAAIVVVSGAIVEGATVVSAPFIGTVDVGNGVGNVVVMPDVPILVGLNGLVTVVGVVIDVVGVAVAVPVAVAVAVPVPVAVPVGAKVPVVIGGAGVDVDGEQNMVFPIAHNLVLKPPPPKPAPPKPAPP